MTSDLSLLGDLARAIDQWEQDDQAPSDLLDATFSLLSRVIPEVSVLKLYILRGNALIPTAATNEELTADEKPIILDNLQSTVYYRAMYSQTPVSPDEGESWFYAPERNNRRTILLTLRLSKSSTGASQINDWLTVIGGELAAAFQRRGTMHLLRQQTEISQQLSQCRNFQDVAQVLADALVNRGQFLTITLATYDEDEQFSGLNILLWANRHQVQELNLHLPMTLDDVGHQVKPVFTEAQAIVYTDIPNQDGINDFLRYTNDGRPLQSAISMPMRSQGEVFGTINLYDIHTDFNITSDQLNLLQSVADQVTNIVLLRNLTTESEYFEAISQRQANVFNELVAGLDYQGMANVLTRHMLQDSDETLLSLGELIYDDARRINGWAVKAVGTSNRMLDWVPEKVLQWDDLGAAVQNALNDNELYYVRSDEDRDPAIHGAGLVAWMENNEAISFLSVPVATGDQPLAVIILTSRRPNAFSEQELDAYRNISELMAALVEASKLSEETQKARQAVEDLVLANRLIATATSYAYMAQAITYTLGKHLTGAVITLFDRPLEAGEMPRTHRMVGFSTDMDVYDVDVSIDLEPLASHQIRRLQAGTPVELDGRVIGHVLPEDIKASIDFQPQAWFVTFGLRSGNQLLGVLGLANDVPIELTEDEINAYSTLADQIGLSIRSQDLLAESAQAQAVASQLVQANQSLSVAGDTSEIGRVVLQILPETFDGVALLLFDNPATVDRMPNTATMETYITREAIHRPNVIDKFPPDESNLAADLKQMIEGEVIEIEDARDDDDSSNPAVTAYFRERDIHSFVTVGLRVGRRLLGFMVLTKAVTASVNAGLLNNLRAIADQVGVTLENRALLRMMEDSLAEVSALYNLNRELLNARRATDLLSVVFHYAAPRADFALLAEIDYPLDGDGDTPHQFRVVSAQGDVSVDQTPVASQAGLAALIDREREIPFLESVEEMALAKDLPGTAASVILLPIYDDARLSRVIGLCYTEPQIFDDATRRLFTAIRDQIEIVTQNQRLLGDVQSSAARLGDQVRVLQMLNRIGGVVIEADDEKTLFDNTCTALYEALDVDHVGVTIFDPATEKLIVISDYPESGAINQQMALTDPLQQRLMTQKETILINDVLQHPEILGETSEILMQTDTNHILLLPMLDGQNNYLGTVGLDVHDKSRPITPDMVNVAQTIIAQVVIAVRNIRLLADTRRQAERMEAVATFSRQLQSTLSVSEILETGLDSLENLVLADVIAIVLYDPASGRPRRVGLMDGDVRSLQVTGGVAVTLDGTSLGVVWRDEQVVNVRDHQADTALAFSSGEGVRSSIAVPVFTRGVLRGVIEIGRRYLQEYTATDNAILQQFAGQFAVAIENAEVYRQSQRVAQSKAQANDISSKLQQQTDIEQILNLTINELGQALGAKRGRIRLMSLEHMPDEPESDR
jgi:GAF domain-containing protein